MEVIFKTPGSMFGHESRIGAQEVHAIRFEDGDKKNQPQSKMGDEHFGNGSQQRGGI